MDRKINVCMHLTKNSSC